MVKLKLEYSLLGQNMSNYVDATTFNNAQFQQQLKVIIPAGNKFHILFSKLHKNYYNCQIWYNSHYIYISSRII